MERIIEIDGQRWKVHALPLEIARKEKDGWHFARVRFDPVPSSHARPRESWLRLEEDLSNGDVVDQYGDEALAEAFLVAEEIRP